LSGTPILSVEGLQTHFNLKRGGKRVQVQAVDNVSLTLAEGEVLGIVGESGCGKTTVGRSIMRLAQPQGGRVMFRGTDVLSASGKGLNDLRLSIRMVFQDPYASLNPRRTIGDSIAEAGDINGAFKDRADRARQIAESLSAVGLEPGFAGRYPHELSGGQRQRVGVARAILPVPSIVIADEPVSALDVSVQAQVLNLLMDLREKLNLSMIFISHDIGVIGYVSHRVAVMYMGRIVEMADTKTILEQPRHPYTLALMAAVPRPDPLLRIAGALPVGEPPSQFYRSSGCAYAPRCPLATDRCRVEAPVLRPLGDRIVACHNTPDEHLAS
jgi:oligopeptide/dipeptide ABC transporter ATP-binding protein